MSARSSLPRTSLMPGQPRPERRRDLDAMRMAVVVGLVFFHSARVFDDGEFYVKNQPPSELVTVFVVFAATWGMPLLFLIAGMGIWYSLRSRSVTTFAVERVQRLLVPLIVGVVIIVPPQVWTRLRGNDGYNESYWDFLPRFFDVRFNVSRFPFVITGSPPQKLFEPAHLWFVVVLFAYSLLLLPVIWCLTRSSGHRLVAWLARHVNSLWVLAVLGLPLALTEALLGSEEGLAGWNRYSYLVFILYGYIVATDRRFSAALGDHRKGSLILAMVTFIIAGAIFAVGGDDPTIDRLVDTDFLSVAMRALKGLSGWFWVLAIMGFARTVGKKPSVNSRSDGAPTVLQRLTAYTAEALLPIYILHQTVIVLLAFYIVEWPIPAALRYLVLCLASFAVIIAVYDVAVRRTRVTRWLFGMKAPMGPIEQQPTTVVEHVPAKADDGYDRDSAIQGSPERTGS